MIYTLWAYPLIWVDECTISSILTGSNLKVFPDSTAFFMCRQSMLVALKIKIIVARLKRERRRKGVGLLVTYVQVMRRVHVNLSLSVPQNDAEWFLTIVQNLWRFLMFSMTWISRTASISPRSPIPECRISIADQPKYLSNLHENTSMRCKRS